MIDGDSRGNTPLRLTHKGGVLLHMELRKKGFEAYSEDLQPEKDLNVDIKLDKEQHGGKRRRQQAPRRPRTRASRVKTPTCQAACAIRSKKLARKFAPKWPKCGL